MEHKYIFTKRELEEFASFVWTDGYYDGNCCDKNVSVLDRYKTKNKDIDDRIRNLQDE
jgi:hypothetical protein